MPVIVLGGIKHTGKSTVGRILSKEMDMAFTDLDDLILKRLPFKWTIRKWYREKGADAFKKKEAEALGEYLANCNPDEFRILSLGGGTLENKAAVKLLKNPESTIFVLDEKEEILYQRIIRKGIPPFLDSRNPKESFSVLYNARRETLLNQGDHIINISGLDQQSAAARVREQIRSIYGR
ncbi:MAG: shikimate kinase [Spirochaetales bacterium]|nr:shikimate kinase [Spirochaetales bacterium]